MEALVTIIMHYESDTFSAAASDLTRVEAEKMAAQLVKRLCKVVATGGRMVSDGVVLDEMLFDLRDDDA